MMQRAFVPVLAWLAGICALVSPLGAQEKVDFNREIRPILAKKCFACHGPDEEHRSAGLRLDHGDAAQAKLESGETAIVPGDPKLSALVKRIHATDPAEQMPPAETGITLTDAQKKLLTRWIEEGASYAPHWSYQRPVKHPLPAVKHPEWCTSPVDHFILERLELAGIKPGPIADKYALIRRASLDLRGLPPTPAEVTQFVNDSDPKAYEKLLDRFLADPAYGERWARVWLDQARYADSRGYGSDPLRPNIWPYRDWVIKAFNNNLPYDQFTIEQLAGDLLPNATVDQKVATAFHRNTMTNTEGGTDDEEFRVVAVKDRVDTTMQVWMGVTIGCAKCHSHKYDPITQKEYYQFYAMFNQTADSDKGDEFPLMDVPSSEYQEAVKKINEKIAGLQKQLQTSTPELVAAQSEWEKSLAGVSTWQTLALDKAEAASGAELVSQPDGSRLAQGKLADTDVYTLSGVTNLAEITAFRLEALADPTLPGQGPGRSSNGNFVLSRIGITAEDANAKTSKPMARFLRVEMPGDNKYLHFAEAQVFVGEENIARKGKATQSSVDYEGPPELAIDGNTSGEYFAAKSTIHTKAESNPWWEVDLGSAQPIDRVVIWNRTDGGTEARIAGFRLLLLDENRKPLWQESPPEVPKPSSTFSPTGVVSVALTTASADYSQPSFDVASAIGKGSLTDTGWAVGGSLGKNHEAVFLPSTPVKVAANTRLSLTLTQNFKMASHLLGRFRVSISDNPAMRTRALVPADILALVDVPVANRTPEQMEKLADYYRGVAPALQPIREQIAQAEKSRPPVPNVPVMLELEEGKRRTTAIMIKGNFLSKGEVVEPALPAALHALPKGEAANRLGMARWIVSRDNPLTSRVAVNRLWSQLFGVGIVETEEDFGIQGELPTHPELLDWMAVEFMDKGWDMKGMLKTLMLSKTYMQSSHVTPESLEKDPRNRLLSRGPRFRLEAEMVRDQALSLAGLLSKKMYGPSVFPPQPDGLWQAAFNGERTWSTSPGEDKYRRGVYVFWRRTIPYPSMTTFDAPSREICSMRRIRTNTPLQAFVTMNDPVYVEAAQGLARRILKEGGADAKSQAAFALSLCLSRPATPQQIETVVGLLESEKGHYKADPAAAKKMATEFAGALPEGMNEVEAAAWTVVSNILLNMDGVLMKG